MNTFTVQAMFSDLVYSVMSILMKITGKPHYKAAKLVVKLLRVIYVLPLLLWNVSALYVLYTIATGSIFYMAY